MAQIQPRRKGPAGSEIPVASESSKKPAVATAGFRYLKGQVYHWDPLAASRLDWDAGSHRGQDQEGHPLEGDYWDRTYLAFPDPVPGSELNLHESRPTTLCRCRS